MDVTGIVRRVDDKSVIVEADDTRILTCKVVATSKFQGPGGKLTLDDFDPGMHVKVQARPSADNEELTLTSLTLVLPAGKPEDAKKAATPEGPPDEEGRPILRRGKPVKSKSSDDDDEDKVAVVKPPSPSSSTALAPEPEPETKPVPVTGEAAQEALIAKARTVTAEFSSKLPNFVCQQFTTRYQRESRVSGWDAKDLISATVVYMDGKEDYQNIKIGNKPAAKGMMDTKGQTSTGDFNSTQAGIMDGRAEFHYVKDAEVKRVKTKAYDFSVLRENSDWEVRTGGQKVFPAYSGRVWIDRDSGRLLRIERQADKIPESFPIDTVEQTVDYDFVRLGDRKVLLPTESENLSCERGSSSCAKNVIEFRNYKEFRGEATIVFDK